MVRKRLKREATTLLTSDQFRNSIFRGESPDVIPLLRKQFVSEITKDDGDDGSRRIKFTITTEAKDRDGDIVRSAGLDLDQFRLNPVVLFAHDSRRPPIGRAVDISHGDGAISATAEFMDNDVDTSGFSDMIFRMVRSGFLRATSIGFIPTKFEFLPEDEDDEDSPHVGFRFPGLDFIESELLEFSIVPVPANPEALIDARRAGIDINPLEMWFEEALDSWASYKECLLVPRTSAECWYKLAKSAVNAKVTTSDSEVEAVFSLGKLLDAPGDTTEEAATSLEIDIEDDEETEKGPVASHTTPMDKTASWDGSAARRQLTTWASSDGSGDKDTMDWAKYAKGFGWFDSAATDSFGSYKLPHHVVRDGSLVGILAGVRAAMGAVLGARGGVDIPDADARRVYNHLAKHIRDADEEPPPFERSFDDDEDPDEDLGEVIVDEGEFDALDEDGGKTLEADDALDKDGDDELEEDLVKSDGEYTFSCTVNGRTVELKSTDGGWINSQILEFMGPSFNEVDEDIQEPHPEVVVQDERPDGAPPLSFNWMKDESGRCVTVVVRVLESDDDDPMTEDGGKDISSEDAEKIPDIVKEVIKEELDRICGRVN